MDISSFSLFFEKLGIISNAECQAHYSNDTRVTNTMMCARRLHKDSCQGWHLFLIIVYYLLYYLLKNICYLILRLATTYIFYCLDKKDNIVPFCISSVKSRSN